mmetsp:Transcript_52763/g.112632  ORF Transcript_52763/g.112632 Transcript_52763/m.112632 type:complete len:203 (-) Transcript_52763:86-694(-)
MLGEVVEAVVEHAKNLCGLVVHDSFLLLVPQDGGRVLARRVVGQLVQVPDALTIVDGVWDQCVVALVGAEALRVGDGGVSWIIEVPATMSVLWVVRASSSPSWMDDGVPNRLVQALQEQHGERAGGPWAAQSDVEVVAVGLWCESAASLHLVSVPSIGALESTLGIHLIECAVRLRHACEKSVMGCSKRLTMCCFAAGCSCT